MRTFDSNGKIIDTSQNTRNYSYVKGKGRVFSDVTPKEPSGLSKVIGGVGNFIKNTAVDAATTLVTTPISNVTQLATRLIAPNSLAAKGYESAYDNNESLNVLGTKVAPQKAFGQGGGKQIAGEGLSAASWLIGGGEAKTAGTIWKLGAKEFAKTQGLRLLGEGAAIGLTSSVGSQLKDGEQKVSLKKTLTDTAISTVATPILAFGLNKLFGKNLPEMLRGKNLENLTKSNDWAIITGTKTGTEAHPIKFDNSINISANKSLYAELVTKYGQKNVIELPSKGNLYNKVEQGSSYFVKGIDETGAKAYGLKYGQESVITHKGFIASNGEWYQPSTGKTLVGKEALKQDGYSTLPTGETFSVGVNGDKILTPKPTIEMPGNVTTPKVPKIPSVKIPLTPEETRASNFKTKEEFIGSELQFMNRTKQPISKNFQQKAGETFDNAWNKINSKPVQENAPIGNKTSFDPSTGKPITETPNIETPKTSEQTKQIEELAQTFAEQDATMPPEFKGGDLKTRSEAFTKAYEADPAHMERVAMGIERDPLIPLEDAKGGMDKIASDIYKKTGDTSLIDKLSESNVGSQSGSNFNGLKLAGENSVVKLWRDLKQSVREKMPNAVKKSEKETTENYSKLKQYFKENNIPEKDFNNIMDEFICK